MPKQRIAKHLLKQKPLIAIGRHLRPLGPHDWGAVRSGEQYPCFAGNVRPHEPRVGLRPVNFGPRLRYLLDPGIFRLERCLDTRKLTIAHTSHGFPHPIHQRLGRPDEIADRGSIEGEEILEACTRDSHKGLRIIG